MATVMDAEGQIIIEEAIQGTLKLEPGYVAVQQIVDGHVEISFYPPEHDLSLYGNLRPYIKNPLPPEDWTAIREQAWQVAVREKYSSMHDEG